MSGIMSMLLGAVSSAAAAVDEFFNRVTLLLPGNGTNGAQNNTFLDSSTNNFTITRNGGNPGMTQGTFSPFSQTGWSNHFTATSAYLNVTAGAGQAFGTNDFTVECWLYASNSACNIMMPSSGTNTWGLLTFNNQLYWQWNGGNLFNGGTVPQDSWVHLAVSRVSGSTSGYVNGTRVFGGTANNDTNNYSGTPTRYIGPGGGGGVPFFASNARILKGTGLYSGASITVPTAPLDSISNTEFLLCNSNRFVDTNTQVTAKAVTISGSPTVQAFSPFAPTAAYSAATVGGSGYFDGTGDWLSSTSTINFSSNAFTIEFWLYTGTPSTTSMPFSLGTSGALQIQASAGSSSNNGNISVSTYGGGGALSTTGNPIIANQWNHIVAVRSSTGTNGAAIFINGSRNVLGTLSTTYVAGPIQIGGISTGAQLINGYMSGLIVTNGTANYSVSNTSITLPTAPPSPTGSALCLNFTNAGITDATAKNVLETVNSAQISTAQSKFGGSSISFNGTNSYLPLPSSQTFAMGGGDWTVEMWLYPNSVASLQGLLSFGSGSWRFFLNSSGLWFLNGSTTIVQTAQSIISTGQWYHVAVCKSGSSVRIFLNGAQVGSTGTDSNTYAAAIAYIGSEAAGSYLNGYIDDLRVTKGFARYTANFTAPTAAFPVQ